MVTDTINTGKYLYLKKCLCLIALTRLERSIEINRQELTEEELTKEIIKEIDLIKNDFTSPSQTLKRDTSIVNFEQIAQGIDIIIKSKHDASVSPWYNKKHYTPPTKKDIYHLPNLDATYAFIKNDIKERHVLYGDVRTSIALVMNKCDYLFNVITAYAHYKDNGTNLSEVIMYCNTLEMIDSVFSLSETGEDALDNV